MVRIIMAENNESGKFTITVRNSKESERIHCCDKITEMILTIVSNKNISIFAKPGKNYEVAKLIRCYEYSNLLKGEGMNNRMMNANKLRKLVWLK